MSTCTLSPHLPTLQPKAVTDVEDEKLRKQMEELQLANEEVAGDDDSYDQEAADIDSDISFCCLFSDCFIGMVNMQCTVISCGHIQMKVYALLDLALLGIYSACAVHEYKLKRAKNTWPVLPVCAS